MPNDSETPGAHSNEEQQSTQSAVEAPFAFLSHPFVQALRFLTKAALAWFLTREELGDAMLVGLFAFLAQHVALFGLDDAVVFAPRLTRSIWRRLLRFLHALGALLTLAVAGAGSLLAWRLDAPSLAPLAFVLAPTVWLGNLAVLPTALLTRHRRFRNVFMVDIAGVSAFAGATLLLAALGAGAWSLVVGWYANAVIGALTAGVLARPLRPADDGEHPDDEHILRYGGHLTMAGLLGFGAERLDSFAIGLWIGRAALGLYEWALHLSQFAVQYTSNLAERFLFPTLAIEHRRGSMSRAFREAIRVYNTFVLPAHVVLAFTARPLVHGLFPAEWHDAAPLLFVLALVGAWRSLEVIALAGLKAAGRSGTVALLSGAHLALLAITLVVTLPRGIESVALGVLAARAAAALVALITTLGLPELRADGIRISTAGAACLASWCLLFVPLAWLLTTSFSGVPLLHLPAILTGALLSWLLVRWLIDRPALLAEWDRIRAHRG